MLETWVHIQRRGLSSGYSTRLRPKAGRIYRFLLSDFLLRCLCCEPSASPIAASTTSRARRLTSVGFFLGKASGSPCAQSVVLLLRFLVFFFAFFAMPQ